MRYTQFMGKDNVPFHTLSFPVTILGSGEPWKLVDYIKSFNYLNYDGGQFSTSRGRGVFMNDALEILPADYWRWWLLSHVPESSDAEFTFCFPRMNLGEHQPEHQRRISFFVDPVRFSSGPDRRQQARPFDECERLLIDSALDQRETLEISVEEGPRHESIAGLLEQAIVSGALD